MKTWTLWQYRLENKPTDIYDQLHLMEILSHSGEGFVKNVEIALNYYNDYSKC